MQAERYYVRNFTIYPIFPIFPCDGSSFSFLEKSREFFQVTFQIPQKKTNKATLSILSDKSEEIEVPDGNFAIFNEDASISVRVTSDSLKCDQKLRKQW